MPWTAQGPYVTTGPFTSANANNMELQYQESTLSLHQDLFTPFVLYGYVGSMDGTTHSQLDATAGVAEILQTDGTLRRRSAGALNYSCTGHPSTTMYLDINPDGTFSWATTHSAVTNHLTLCSVTTDGSSNITGVTDARTLGTTLLPSMAGRLTLPVLSGLSVFGASSLDNGAITTDGAGSVTANGIIATNQFFRTTVPGSGGGWISILDIPVGGSPTVSNAWRINYDGSTGNIIVYDVTHGRTDLTIDTAGNATFPGTVVTNNFFQTHVPGNSNNWISILDMPIAGTPTVSKSWRLTYDGSTANVFLYNTTDGNVPWAGHPDGSFWFGTIRNGGVTTQVPIYTGTSTPTGSPPTGSIWIKA